MLFSTNQNPHYVIVNQSHSEIFTVILKKLREGENLLKDLGDDVTAKIWGCYIEDESKKRFIDTSMGSGAQIIGHNNPLIRKIGKN